jgi:hypothetical protein
MMCDSDSDWKAVGVCGRSTEVIYRRRGLSECSIMLPHMTCGFMWAMLGCTMAHEARPTDSSSYLSFLLAGDSA